MLKKLGRYLVFGLSGVLPALQGPQAAALTPVPGAPPLRIAYAYPTLATAVGRRIHGDFLTLDVCGNRMRKGFELEDLNELRGLTFTVAPALPAGFVFNSRNGEITTPQRLTTPAPTATYLVTLTTASWSAQAPVTITVDPADMDLDLADAISAGSSTTATVTSPYLDSSDTFTWTISRGTILSGQGTPTLTYLAGVPGTLTLTCVATDGSLSSRTARADQEVLAPASAQIFAQPKMHVGDSFPVTLPVPGVRAWNWTSLSGGVAGFMGTDLDDPLEKVQAAAPGSIQLQASVTARDQASATGTAGVAVVQHDFATPGAVTGHGDEGSRVGTAAAARLYSGRVLVVGPRDQVCLYDPLSDTWKAVKPSLFNHDGGHSVTVLADGKVLVVGGTDASRVPIALSHAELYDPAQDTWTWVGDLPQPRANHTATLLPNGQVLVAGGDAGGALLQDPPELYTEGGGWQAVTNSQFAARTSHTATLLRDGRVLFAGGSAPAQIYAPDTNTWQNAAPMVPDRSSHSATLLRDGSVLVAGGYDGSNSVLNSAARYFPDRDQWQATAGTMATPRAAHGAALLADGTALVLGGTDGATNGQHALASSERYDPCTDAWTSQSNLQSSRQAAATLALFDGRVLTVSGYDSYGTDLNAPELFTPGDPVGTQWNYSAGAKARFNHTASLLPDGRVLMAGGSADSATATAACQIFTPATASSSAINQWTGPQAPAASMNLPRRLHSATVLAGKVLVIGGDSSTSTYLDFTPRSPQASMETYDPASNTWTLLSGHLVDPRAGHTATPIGAGVLVAGGLGTGAQPDSTSGALGSVEYLDAAGNPVYYQSNLPTRALHAAAAVADPGEGPAVLLLGGADINGNTLASVDEFAPGQLPGAPYRSVTALQRARLGHTATTLANGQVLVVGGFSDLNGMEGTPGLVLPQASSVELYDPAQTPQRSTLIQGLHHPRALHTATLLPDGTVLVAGGLDNDNNLVTTAELFDPNQGTWTDVGDLAAARAQHTATALPDGSVLVFGGTYDTVRYLIQEYTEPAMGNLEIWR